jgi:hypothetical protein
MNFWIEWALAIHRAVWFPLNWTLGLERPGVAVPLEYAPSLAGQAPMPPLRVIQGGLAECTPTRRPSRTAGKQRARIVR